MPGLLAQLDLEIGNFDVGSMLDGVIGQLGDLGGAVGGLTEGPGVVGEILAKLGDPPKPDGLDGIANFTASVGGAISLVPSDTSGPLAPLLAPFQQIAGLKVGVSITGMTAAFDAVRELVRLTTGRSFGGPQPLPDGSTPPDAINLARIRGVLDEVDGQLDAMLDNVDPSRLLALIQRFGSGAQDMHSTWPKLPITADMFEAFALVERWQDMSPATLTDHLAHTLAGSARFIALPRTRVVDPALEQAREAARVGERSAKAKLELLPLLAELPARLAAGERLYPSELASLRSLVDELETTSRALRLAGSPLASIESLPTRVEREFMRVLRVVDPAIDRAAIEAQARSALARLPAAAEAPLGDLVTAIETLDLSVITGPISAIRQAIETAVDTAKAALDQVRQALMDLLQPVADGIAALVEAIGLDKLQAALGQVPDMIRGFVEGEIMTRLASLKADVESAVHTVSSAVDAFKPQELLDQLEARVAVVAEIFEKPEVRSVFAGAQTVVQSVVDVLEQFPANLRSAADQSVQTLDSVRAVAEKIPSDLIPDAAKPPLQQAVDAIADLDITGTVGVPIASAVDTALEQGVLPLLTEFEDLLGEVRDRLEKFKPSSLISDDIEKPFQDLLAKLREFKPSDLLDDIADALAGLREQVHVVEPDELLAPLIELHAQLRGALAKLDPVVVLKPVEDAIQSAIQSLLEASGFEAVFAGVREFLEELDGWVDLLHYGQQTLERAAERMARPVDVEAQLSALVDGALARVDQIEFAALAPALSEGQRAAQAMDARRIAAELAPALRAASNTADLLVGADVRDLTAALRALPSPAELGFVDAELGRIADRLLGVATTLDAAVDPWHALSPRLARMAGELETSLRGYALLGVIEGRNVLSGFLEPPTNVAGLRVQIGDALRESVRLPVVMMAGLVGAITPHLAGLAGDLGRVLGALHGKFDAITGEQGLLGTVKALDEGLDLLRDFDLGPIRDPLNTQIYQPILGVVDAIDPEPLRAILQAVKDALESLLDLANLISPATLAELDGTYAKAVDALAMFSPRTVLIEVLDPVYERVLADILPLFDLVTRLRVAVEKSADELPPEIVAQLSRVETAFDALLHSLPLQPSGGVKVSVSVSASANT
ncbi:hypothetical protein ACNOYE_28325 [Nannocystaceae bacterium ST9]